MNLIDMSRVVTVILRLWRKTLITPCKRSAARGKGNLSHPQPRSGLNSYGVPVWCGVSSHPELRFACTGLSKFISSGDKFLKSIQIKIE